MKVFEVCQWNLSGYKSLSWIIYILFGNCKVIQRCMDKIFRYHWWDSVEFYYNFLCVKG